MMLIAIGIIMVVVFEALYVLTNIFELQYGEAIGMLITIIGVIQFGRKMGYFRFKKPTEDRKTL